MGSIRVGNPHTHPDGSSHVPGIHEGNQGPYEEQAGHHEDGKADARRSTGIDAKRHDPILDIMPNLSPG